jgi:hypothetical protein
MMRFLEPARCPVEAESRAFTDAALADLRAVRWSPTGWARFAGAVAVRSAEQAVAHPRAVGELTALHTAFAVASRGRGRWWLTLSWMMGVTHLGLLGERRSIGWANAISLTRANLPAFGRPLGRWVGVVAVASDKLDGTLARIGEPTMFGFYADSLADAAFWTWVCARHERSRLVRFVSLVAWVAPVVAVAAASITKGEMAEAPRPAVLRPAAAMQAVLAVRAVRAHRPGTAFTGTIGGEQHMGAPGCRRVLSHNRPRVRPRPACRD